MYKVRTLSWTVFVVLPLPIDAPDTQTIYEMTSDVWVSMIVCIMITKFVWNSYTIQEVAMPQQKEHTDFCWWWQMWSNPTQVHRNAQCVHHWDLCRGLCLANQRRCSRVQKSPPCLWFVQPAICSPCPGWCSPRGWKEVVQHIAHGSHRCPTRRKVQEGRMRETTRAPPQSEPTARVIAPFCW